MEEMQNLNVEDTITEVVEVATDKLTFKENILAYSLAGVFVIGLTTVGYMGYKGTKKLANIIRDKKRAKVETEEAVSAEDKIKDYDTFENETEE
jgi:hypothetical protein